MGDGGRGQEEADWIGVNVPTTSGDVYKGPCGAAGVKERCAGGDDGREQLFDVRVTSDMDAGKLK